MSSVPEDPRRTTAPTSQTFDCNITKRSIRPTRKNVDAADTRAGEQTGDTVRRKANDLIERIPMIGH
ncbi:hypothetical protein EVAR_53984_1 [Eumeta japonica]|uniref:Uncharacterized protein n=1 Tax=Eumeta variegata TaxID=151549 RepID=A0A4C1YU75_EUMVA|nr:hypothetical protein EVAR_53984_1 [Eumeta japonica]